MGSTPNGPTAPGADADAKLSGLLQKLEQTTDFPANSSSPSTTPAALPDPFAGVTPPPPMNAPASQAVATTSLPSQPASASHPGAAEGEYIPREPSTLRETDITDTELEALILKFLLARGNSTGHAIAEQVRLPFIIVEPSLTSLKQERMVAYRDSAPAGDYIYELTELGVERARRLAMACTYFGSAPVSLHDYRKGVEAQTIEFQRPSQEDLERAFRDLLISPDMYDRLGPAISSGRGMFLFGFPGNGKTSIAERVTAAFGKHIWIPRALSADGHIVRLYDPMMHQAAPLQKTSGWLDETAIDERWVRIERPTIISGGELTMDMLEVRLNKATGTSEAPLQLKSNCGTLVIDDLGRQRMGVDELLNRWIVPLEKRFDYLNLSTGKKIEVPFNQLVIFSTNLEPRDLVDDAFLRRIPYKIEVTDPSETEFRQLFRVMCKKLEIEYNEKAVDYLIARHYAPKSRPFRCCQPRDLLLQIRNFCFYKRVPVELRPEYIDYAVDCYFSIM